MELRFLKLLVQEQLEITELSLELFLPVEHRSYNDQQ